MTLVLFFHVILCYAYRKLSLISIIKVCMHVLIKLRVNIDKIQIVLSI
jgi:hypothetical protein